MTKDPYLDALGINAEDLQKTKVSEKLREAYDRAHEIRKFEIEMYWRRSAYLWTLQAAAFGGLALILSTIESLGWLCQDFAKKPEQSVSIAECNAERIKLMLVLAVWAFGTFSALAWLLLLRGAKFWQNNWERHVDRLEDYFSGALYKTYVVDEYKRPYSVSKLNELMALFTLILWCAIGSGSIIVFSGADTYAFFFVLVVAIMALFLPLLIKGIRMSDFGKQMTEPSALEDEKMIVKRSLPRITKPFQKDT